ncbi:unnamed protein product [Clavelina lepadiformis]|uniref:Major facilitator superfamily (MFS) profile domain-containing protein n=1 Tax=Clavelina lepadiformis TaxID=159417 RepID=A0ABP0EUK4_CLALP
MDTSSESVSLAESSSHNGQVEVEIVEENNGTSCSNENEGCYDVTNENTSSEQKLTLWVVWSSLLALFSAYFMFGYSAASINAIATPARKAFQEHHLVRYNTTLSEDDLNLIWTITVAAFPVGGILGCFIPNILVKKFGKLRSMLYGHVVVVIASVFLGLTSLLKSFEVIVIGRILIGVVTSSCSTSITPSYVVEVCSLKWRGMFGSTVMFFMSIGSFTSTLLGLNEILGGDELWPMMLTLTGLPSLVFIFLFYFMPESPRHLYITERRKEEARKLLMKLRKCEDVSDELDKMETELQSQASSKQMSLVQLFQSPALRFQLITAMVLGSLFQLTGLNGLVAYLKQFYVAVGIPATDAQYASLGPFATLLVVAVIPPFTIERVGRKKLLFIGYLIEGISLLLLTITIEIGHLAYWIPYLSIVFISGFLVGFAIGPGGITLLAVSEFFPQTSRTAALMTTSLCLWTSFTFVVVLFPYMIAAIRGFTFLIFSSIAFAVAVFVYFAVPEIKDRSFVEIQQIFKKKKFCCESRDSSNLSVQEISLETPNMTSSA